MNAGSTMERVYLDLKARIVGGAYPPGTRLDPFHLAKRLAASPTPVREALHRLSGERIVDSWHQEGFRQPIFAESDLCDLYQWAGALIGLALRAPALGSAVPASLLVSMEVEDYPARVARLFRAIALLCDNREIRYAIVNFVERSEFFRAAEARTDPAADEHLSAMEAAFRSERWTELRSKSAGFYRRRIAHAGRVVAALRPRSQTIG
ncbi:GntR family transcriptional regulator [Sphingopyxis sp.]|uniref:GntR family transcriptional regulator n=1 Tax=Sphingopyxis sp. TaxID=1908224 RepID=UPI003D6DA7C1